MGISCQRNGHWAATNHLLGRGFVQPIKELSSVAGRCAGRGYALIRQLANGGMWCRSSLFFVIITRPSNNLPVVHSVLWMVKLTICTMQDYFEIVKKPMDLSLIKRKLDTGQYTDPWQYVDDVWLMFDNAWLYNRKSSKVHKNCSKVRHFSPVLCYVTMVKDSNCVRAMEFRA